MVQGYLFCEFVFWFLNKGLIKKSRSLKSDSKKGGTAAEKNGTCNNPKNGWRALLCFCIMLALDVAYFVIWSGLLTANVMSTSHTLMFLTICKCILQYVARLWCDMMWLHQTCAWRLPIHSQAIKVFFLVFPQKSDTIIFWPYLVKSSNATTRLYFGYLSYTCEILWHNATIYEFYYYVLLCVLKMHHSNSHTLGGPGSFWQRYNAIPRVSASCLRSCWRTMGDWFTVKVSFKKVTPILWWEKRWVSR